MKKLCVLLAAMLMLCGCSLLPNKETEPQLQDLSYFVGGEKGPGVIYTPQGGALVGGDIEKDIPTETAPVDIPITTAPPLAGSPLVGTWEYVETVRGDAYVLTINEYGGVEIAQYYCREDGSRSLLFRLSCPLEMVDGLITFSGDTEYDPPSLVLKPVYEEGVGDILRVVSSASNFSDLTEYFYRCS